jgi:hypothetical protein
MTTLSVLVALWGTAVVAFIALMVYRANLTNHETDQLFLNEEAPSALHQENDEVIRRAQRIGPICTGVGSVAVIMTLVVVGVWVAQILPHAAN